MNNNANDYIKIPLMPSFLYILFNVVLFTVGFSSMGMAPFVMLAAPLPTALFVLKYGIGAGVIVAAAGCIAACWNVGLTSGLIYILEFAMLGTAIGTLLAKCREGDDYALHAITISLMTKIAVATLLFYITGLNPWLMPSELPKEATEMFKSFASAANGMVNVSDADIAAYIKNVSQSVSMMLPSMLIFLSAADSMFCYYASRSLLRKNNKIAIVKMPPFSEWRFPKNIFYALGGALVADLAARVFPQEEFLQIISLNIMEVLRGVFLIEALAVCWYFMNQIKVNKILRIIVVIVSVSFAPVSYMLSMAGVLDIWYDFRNRIKNRRK